MKKFLIYLFSALYPIVYSVNNLAAYKPYIFQHVYDIFEKLPTALSLNKKLILEGNIRKLDTFESNYKYKFEPFYLNVFKFLYGLTESESVIRCVKKIENLEIFYQCENDIKPSFINDFIVKNSYFFWKKVKFKDLQGFEKQLAKYYKANVKSKIQFFYAINKSFDEIFQNISFYDQLSLEDKVNLIWGIKVDGIKYCTIWTVKNVLCNENKIFIDSNQNIIAKKINNQKIFFYRKTNNNCSK